MCPLAYSDILFRRFFLSICQLPKDYLLRNFLNGFATFSKNYRWCFIDKNGTDVVEPKYTDVEPFANGLAKVTIRNVYEETNSYLDTTSKTVWSKTEDRYSAYNFDDNYL